jgi:hypothetical protein
MREKRPCQDYSEIEKAIYDALDPGGDLDIADVAREIELHTARCPSCRRDGLIGVFLNYFRGWPIRSSLI